jgi:hypothetical protein
MPKKLSEQPITGETLHEWTIQEYEQHERALLWYILMLSVGLAMVLFAMFTGNFLFAVIIILFAIILFLQSHQLPPQVAFKITELGVILGDRFYPYSEFDSFYIIYQPPEVKTLYLTHKSIYRPMLRIPLLDENPVETRHTLREFLSEDLEKEEEPMADRVARNWRIH